MTTRTATVLGAVPAGAAVAAGAFGAHALRGRLDLIAGWGTFAWRVARC